MDIIMCLNYSIKRIRNLAIRYHGEQTYGDHPYVYHLDKVASVAIEFMGDYYFEMRDNVLSLAYLHDVLEDTETTLEKLVLDVGHVRAHEVWCLTDADGKNREERKLNTWWKIRKFRQTIFVKLCDRIANVREGGKLDMYKKEYPVFKAALFIPGQFDRMWEELDRLLV